MKIVVVGLGYVGLANAVLLAQRNEVIGIDISIDRVALLNKRISPLDDQELINYLRNEDLNISGSTDLENSIVDADFVLISTPTNYDEATNYFDTSSVENVIGRCLSINPNISIVIKSTIPIGFVDEMLKKYPDSSIFFSPEFLREGRALFDNLYPSRIVVGDLGERGKAFANLMRQGAKKTDVEILLTNSREAEAIKLFANTYLAMRVAFFNELDSYALVNNLDARQIIDGISLDPRIGQNYNNPSFGYGGYCLPKDTKQLLANFSNIPQSLISAIIDSNEKRKNLIADKVLDSHPHVVGIHRLAMKAKSDNIRATSILDVARAVRAKGVETIIYEPLLGEQAFEEFEICNNLKDFFERADIVITNRYDEELANFGKPVLTRDIFNND